MSEDEPQQQMTKSRWMGIVAGMLADHPDWMEATVTAMQAGVSKALKRKDDRIEDLSVGLWQALTTRPGAKRRDSEAIIEGIEASVLANSPWAAEAIEKERKLMERKEDG